MRAAWKKSSAFLLAVTAVAAVNALPGDSAWPETVPQHLRQSSDSMEKTTKYRLPALNKLRERVNAESKKYHDVSVLELRTRHDALHSTQREEAIEVTDANTKRPAGKEAAELSRKADELQHQGREHIGKGHAHVQEYETALIDLASQQSASAGVSAAAGGCEVCVYVVENKQMHQPFLCRGLKDPAYQQTVSIRIVKTALSFKQLRTSPNLNPNSLSCDLLRLVPQCVTTLISLMWWLENQVYWVNYGCQRQSGSGQWEWVKPCPAHAICAWMQNLYDRQSFCPADPKYRKPA